MTLNSIAEDIAYKLGDQFNSTLKESIKHTLIIYRSKFMRDDIDRNGTNVNSYYQSIVLDFEKVNIFDDLDADVSCLATMCTDAKEEEKYYLLKSKKKIPAFIRLKSNAQSPFRFIGSLTRRTRFKSATPETLDLMNLLPYREQTIYYYISNNYLYLLNTSEICEALIEGIFDDPREAFALCKGELFKDDSEFPISNDLLYFIIDGIITRSYPLRNKEDGEQINLQSNDKNSNTV